MELISNTAQIRTANIQLALICVMTCIITSCTSSSTTSFDNPNMTAKATGAAATFVRSCAICHGADGAGKTINRVAVPSLREGRAVTDTDAVLNDQITNGGNGMPAFSSQLSRAEIEELVKYIREDLQKK